MIGTRTSLRWNAGDRAATGSGRRFIATVAASAVILAGCGSGRATASGGAESAGPSQGHPTAAPKPAAPACSPTAIVSHWTLERRAAQVLVAPVEETDVSAAAPLVELGIGGLILFGSAAPTTLPTDLAALRGEALDALPPLVMTDEEGGEIQRMANLVGSLPWPRTMAQTMTPAAVRSRAAQVGRAMRADGVTMDLAPVLDLSDSPGPNTQFPDGPRSFGLSSATAARYGVAFAEGLLDGGVIPVVKHFPGLGQATGNTDDEPATVPPLAILQQGALIPFRAAIKAGLPAVMVSQAIVPGLSNGRPASLSRAVVTGVLRDQLGFKGLVVTDTMSATAVTAAGFDLTSAAWHAVRAGDDLILYDSADPVSGAEAMIGGIVNAVNGGMLATATLDNAVVHVLKAKGIHACR